MSVLPPALRGPIFMIVATGAYLVNDTMMKLAMEGLPLYEVLFLRGVFATMWSVPLLLALGQARNMPLIFDRRVVTRNSLELVAILCYVVALANMPIADATALGQLTPLLIILGSALLFGEAIGAWRWVLIGIGFVGAVMVAQPTMEGISVYALLALANAVMCAARDLAGRRVAAHVPGLIVACSAGIIVLLGAAAMHLLIEEWVMPQARSLLLLAAAGLFLIFGHFFIFMAYRVGSSATVAPFYYCFTLWAVISGLVVFGEFPNALALSGMALVVASGLAVVMHDRRKPTVIA